MKVIKNTAHNSLELDFEGVKPSEELRKVMRNYGFWWFQKEKKWIHSLETDGEFFEKFVDERIKPLASASAPATVAPTADAVAAAAASLSEEDKQKLLASLMK